MSGAVSESAHMTRRDAFSFSHRRAQWVEQSGFRAVLAHEYGHFSHRDTAVVMWPCA